jgi:hypothetical protein
MRTTTLKVRIAASAATLLTAFVLVMATMLATAPTASADTSGYGRIRVDQLWNSYFDFGIPSWVTNNTGQRSTAKAACSAYLGDRLGLKWWMWWAPEPVCSMVIDRVWQPNKGMAICGSIPLKNVWGTRVWAC